MPNHIHLLCRDPDMQLPKAMHFFMTETSKAINKRANRINRLWGGRYHSSLVNDAKYFTAVYRYIYRNPVRAGYADSVESFKYSTLRGLLGHSKLVVPVEEEPFLFSGSPESVLKWLNAPEDIVDNLELQQGLRHRKFGIT